MQLLPIFKKVVNKLYTHVLRFFGREGITLAKITPRNDLQKIGTDYGGWIVPADLLDENSVCYCVGCGEDISFDLGLIEQFGCDVFAFDPTPRAIKYVEEKTAQNDKYHFSEIGLWDTEDLLKFYVPKNPKYVSHSLLNLQKTENYIEVEVAPLSKIMEDNDHNKLDLLKLDIEGAEYRTIESIAKDDIDIKVICVEFDECFNALDNNFPQRIRKSVNKLQNLGYSLICAQGNGNYTFVKNV
jgi:FkbM family methyltransferase